MNVMEKALQLAVALTVLCADLFGQSINSVTVSPQNPTSDDDVTLVINGDRWSSDTHISSITTSQNLNTWTVDIAFMSEGIGLPVLVPFDTIVSLGTMAIGYYDCQVNGNVNGQTQDFDGTAWAVLEPVGVNTSPVTSLKFMCTPNPIAKETMLNLSIPKSEKVILKVYDILGQEVAKVIDQQLAAGVHRFKYLASGLNPGKYYFHLIAGEETLVQPVLRK